MKYVVKKKVKNLFVVVMAQCIAVFLSCDKTSNHHEGEIQLLERIVYPDVLLHAKSLTQCQIQNAVKYTKYEYDNQNRITKISSYNKSKTLVGTETFTYMENDLIKVVYEEACNPNIETREFAKNGNKITVTIEGGYLNYLGTRTYTFELDEDGFPVKLGSAFPDGSYPLIYQYQDGNLIKLINSSQDYSHQNYSYIYEYDNKKSPFYHCQTPKWYMFYVSNRSGSMNNIVKEIGIAAEDNKVYNETRYKYGYDRNGFPTKRITNSNGKEHVVEFRYKRFF